MGLAVGDIVELVGPDRPVLFLFVEFPGEPVGYLHVIVGIGIGNRWDLDQFGAAQPHHVLLFVALGFRDDDDRAIAPRIAHQGKPDPGISGGTLDHHAAGLERAAPFRIQDNRKRRPVLDGAAGIEKLRLAEDLATGLLGGLLEPDQRRIAYGVQKPIA